MRMIALLLAVVVVGAAAPAAGASSRGCTGGKGRVVARSAKAVVRLETKGPPDEHSLIWRGCLRSRDRYVRVGDGYSDLKGYENLDGFELAGRYVAYRRSASGSTYGPQVSAGVVDLRSGRTVTEQHLGENGWSIELAVSTRGQLGLVIRDGGEDVVSVALPGERVPRKLDRGPVGSIRGLTVSGGVARWRHAGEARSAVL